MIHMRYKGDIEPDKNVKCCSDCYWCQAALVFWCMNDEACKTRGTKIPGIKKCTYWSPIKKATWLEKIGFTSNIIVKLTVNKNEIKNDN